MTDLFRLAILAVAFWPAPLLALEKGDADPRAMVKLSEDGAAPFAASIEDIAWLEGDWIGAMPEGPVEHVILPAKHGQMPSFVRAVNEGGIIFYEIAAFVERDGGVLMRLKHFTPEMHGWEERDAPIERPLLAKDENNLYFHRATFSRTGPDSFTVYFLNMTPEGEELDTLVIPFRRR